MISALEGWSFTGPKGQQTIRASDHAMLQPMFQVKLQEVSGKLRPVVSNRLRAKYTAPPGEVTGPVPPSDITTTVSTILATRDLGLDIGGAHIVADVSLEVAGRRARRHHRPERRRQDDALQPAVGCRRSDARHGRARRP